MELERRFPKRSRQIPLRRSMRPSGDQKESPKTNYTLPQNSRFSFQGFQEFRLIFRPIFGKNCKMITLRPYFTTFSKEQYFYGEVWPLALVGLSLKPNHNPKLSLSKNLMIDSSKA